MGRRAWLLLFFLLPIIGVGVKFCWNYEVTWRRLAGLTRAADYRGIPPFREQRGKKGRLMPSSVVLTLRKPRRVRQPKVVVAQS
jgi:hypothetical protein